MSRSIFLVALFGGVAFATTSLALPDIAPGADTLCSGFEEVVDGVWTDQSGYEMLRFRLARNADGSGCYAWLNAAAPWGIGSAGSSVLRV